MTTGKTSKRPAAGALSSYAICDVKRRLPISGDRPRPANAGILFSVKYSRLVSPDCGRQMGPGAQRYEQHEKQSPKSAIVSVISPKKFWQELNFVHWRPYAVPVDGEVTLIGQDRSVVSGEYISCIISLCIQIF